MHIFEKNLLIEIFDLDIRTLRKRVSINAMMRTTEENGGNIDDQIEKVELIYISDISSRIIIKEWRSNGLAFPRGTLSATCCFSDDDVGSGTTPTFYPFRRFRSTQGSERIVERIKRFSACLEMFEYGNRDYSLHVASDILYKVLRM